MSLDSGEITTTDLSPNAGILGTQIADSTIQARNFAPGAIPPSAIVNGNNIFIINSSQSASFTTTSGSSSVGTTTATITHNLGYVPITFLEVSITHDWNGSPGIFPLPYITPATNSGVDSAQLFVIASYLKVKGVTTTTITFEAGVLAGTNNLAGTITAYFLQETQT